MTTQDILAELTEGRHDPYIFKVIFLAGGPGSGKTTVANILRAENYGLKTLNIDVFYEALKGMSQLTAWQVPTDLSVDPAWERSKHLLNVQRGILEQGRLGVIVDATGRNFNQIQAMKDHAESLGYDTLMIYVKTHTAAQVARQELRDRRLSQDIVTQINDVVQQNIATYQKLFGSEFLEFDNSEMVDFNPKWDSKTRDTFIKDTIKNRMHSTEYLTQSASSAPQPPQSLSAVVARWLKKPPSKPPALTWLNPSLSSQEKSK